jgi:hypothetical protein
MTTQAALVTRVIGDDWSFAFACVEADGVTPLSLAGYTVGAQLFVPYATAPVALTAPAGTAALANAANGQIAVTVAAATTGAIQMPADPCAPGALPTRLQVWLVDPTGKRRTVALVEIALVDPRSAAGLPDDTATLTLTINPETAFTLVAAAGA